MAGPGTALPLAKTLQDCRCPFLQASLLALRGFKVPSGVYQPALAMLAIAAVRVQSRGERCTAGLKRWAVAVTFVYRGLACSVQAGVHSSGTAQATCSKGSQPSVLARLSGSLLTSSVSRVAMQASLHEPHASVSSFHKAQGMCESQCSCLLSYLSHDAGNSNHAKRARGSSTSIRT